MHLIMIPLYTKEDFKNSKSTDKLPCKCYNCNNTFFTTKKLISQEIRENRNRIKYCSQKCHIKANHFTSKKVKCKNCNKEFYKVQSQIKRSKNNFCSKSCSATYNNKHKTHGTKRSKIEIWIESQLCNLYPNLKIDYNKKNTINSELDVYVPSLSLAFELNGIFHYEPIFGKEKLKQIQNNDQIKFQACLEKNIELVLIDTSSLKYFKPNRSQKYLDIITKIIDNKINLLKS